jgi:hypothetical protein
MRNEKESPPPHGHAGPVTVLAGLFLWSDKLASARQWCGSKGAYNRPSYPCHYCTNRDGFLRQGAVDKAKADDQRHAGERQHHHLKVRKAVGGKQRKIVHDTLPKGVPVISRSEAAKGSWLPPPIFRLHLHRSWGLRLRSRPSPGSSFSPTNDLYGTAGPSPRTPPVPHRPTGFCFVVFDERSGCRQV